MVQVTFYTLDQFKTGWHRVLVLTVLKSILLGNDKRMSNPLNDVRNVHWAFGMENTKRIKLCVQVHGRCRHQNARFSSGGEAVWLRHNELDCRRAPLLQRLPEGGDKNHSLRVGGKGRLEILGSKSHALRGFLCLQPQGYFTQM